MVTVAEAFAPSNIALCKYWGKRNLSINLPVNSSLSISLGNKGTVTKINIIDNNKDQIILNNNLIEEHSNFYKKIINFLNLLRAKSVLTPDIYFNIITHSNLPVAAGLASSASGFAALVKALNQLLNWQLSNKELSILARLGSGSASRSLWHGFVKWHAGTNNDGTDSFAELLDYKWPELCIGLLILDHQQKYMGSREAMKISVETSPLYKEWPQVAIRDLKNLESAIITKDFSLFGSIAEANALAMHAVMLSARPSIMYSNSDTINNIKKIWELRNNHNLDLYFTQDAGANLKLLFLYQDSIRIKALFPNIEIIRPFEFYGTIDFS